VVDADGTADRVTVPADAAKHLEELALRDA